MKMGFAGDAAELIKWWDALDLIAGSRVDEDVERGLQMARSCDHPDARWLSSLFPAGVAVTKEGVERVMLEQGEDPRAMHIAWTLGRRIDSTLLQRAAERGYAPSQAMYSLRCSLRSPVESFELAQKASAQGDRRGLCQLGCCLFRGAGCEADRERAIDLFKRAAALDLPLAQYIYSESAFGRADWEKYFWWGRAASRGYAHLSFCRAICGLLVSFENGENCRILHTVGPLLRGTVDAANYTLFGKSVPSDVSNQLVRVVQLHNAMLDRARAAVHCWSVAGRRIGVVRDVRVMIAKMVWEEAWRWSGTSFENV
jgi:hypothetical protein